MKKRSKLTNFPSKKLEFSELEESQKNFYLPKFNQYKNSPKSLSWRDSKTQKLRFQILSNLFYLENKKKFSVHEVGCGLAHYYNYLQQNYPSATYSGSDLVEEMVTKCKSLYKDVDFQALSIVDKREKLNKIIGGSDYYCLSGTFNPKENNSKKEWEQFIFTAIENMFFLSKKGIAINFLTAYSDFYDPHLYYAQPAKILNWCLQNLSRFASIHHDYALYEFTIYVYKQEFMEGLPSFLKRYKKI